MPEKRRVIFVTDGDNVARTAVERSAYNLGARCISASGGNPTPITGREIVELIKQAPYDPVIVMFDDRGKCHQGKGEEAMEYVAGHPEIEVLGVLAVASNTKASNVKYVDGFQIKESITSEGKFVKGPVDKFGIPEEEGHRILEGDTVDIINELGIPVVIGIGDIGKMDGADAWWKGSPVTTRALQEILKRSGFDGQRRGKET